VTVIRATLNAHCADVMRHVLILREGTVHARTCRLARDMQLKPELRAPMSDRPSELRRNVECAFVRGEVERSVPIAPQALMAWTGFTRRECEKVLEDPALIARLWDEQPDPSPEDQWSRSCRALKANPTLLPETSRGREEAVLGGDSPR
jgi:hypothetical protein